MRTILARPIAVAAVGALLLVPRAQAAVSHYAPISLPADAGIHANAHSEWWYFTGHLRDHAGHRYGYELTTFKFSGVKGMIPLQFSDTVYRIDFAITDESRHTFRSMIAYLPVTPGRTSLPAGTLHSAMKADTGTMSIDTLPGPGLAYRLRGSMSAGSLDLTLRTTRPPLLEGQGGVEQIANGYSYYYSLTNMQSSGSLVTVGGRQRVDGVTWMDHQWGNWDWRQDKGWDWLSVQLSNGTSLALTNFTDARGTAEGLQKYVGHAAGIMFAIALLDASVIGAAAVGLSTSYAVSDAIGVNHSLHRQPGEAKGFYAIYALLMAIAATIVLIPGSPLGLLTQGVQTLAGVLLPSAVVFLLLLCNDKAVMGPWANSTRLNIITSAIIWILVLLSIILTASVLFPGISGTTIVAILAGGSGVGLVLGAGLLIQSARDKRSVPPADLSRGTASSTSAVQAGHTATATAPDNAGTAAEQETGQVATLTYAERLDWRMPPLANLTRPVLSTQRKTGLGVLRGYLLLATILVIVKIVQVALGS